MPQVSSILTKRYMRYIPSYGGFSLKTMSASFKVGRVYYMPLIIDVKVTIDRLGCCHGSAAAGNFYLAIYESEDEAPTTRLAFSTNTASNGINQRQQITLTPQISLTPGLYYAALEADNTTNRFWQNQGEITSTRRPQNITNGPAFYIEDLISYGEPPSNATPDFGTDAVPDVARTYLVWARVSSTIP